MTPIHRKTAPRVLDGAVVKQNRQERTLTYWNTGQTIPVIVMPGGAREVGWLAPEARPDSRHGRAEALRERGAIEHLDTDDPIVDDIEDKHASAWIEHDVPVARPI